MIYTSNYENYGNRSNFVSISEDKGEMANFNGQYYQPLVPNSKIIKIWSENVKNLSEEENIYNYIENYYYEVLKKLDVEHFFTELISKNGVNFILGCYEKDGHFCHRLIAAAYLETIIGYEIPEIKNNNGKLEIVKESNISKMIKRMLSDVIYNDPDLQPKIHTIAKMRSYR